MIKKYVCMCGNEFKREVFYSQGTVDTISDKSKGKKGSLSTQVRCPACFNFIPTWDFYYDDEGKKIKQRRN